VKGVDTCKGPAVDCLDCQDLHFKSIAHECHCHYDKKQLPNLGEFIDAKLESVFYVRDQETKDLVGLRLMFDNGKVLTIKTTEVQVARRI